MFESLWLQLQHPNTQWVLAGTLLLGAASGVLGSFVLLRRQSLIGDAMAHSALPGVCLAFLFTGQKSLPFFLLGAALAGLLGTWCIQLIPRLSKTKEDSAIGIVLSVFFGVGIILLTYIQQQGAGSQSGLDSFLFGQAASLIRQDIILIAGISALLLLLCIVFFKEFTLITFDLAFAKGLGMPVRFLNGLLACLIVCAVVIGLQTVGVILMAAMLITPAIAARYWTERLTGMMVIAGITGGVSGVAGTLLSTTMKGMATGPLMILSATMIFLFSMICAPKRGLAAKVIRLIRLRRKTSREQVLLTIYEQYEKKDLYVTAEGVRKKRRISPALCLKVLNDLEKERCIVRIENGVWQMTRTGIEKGYHIALKQRMYEVYLMHEMELANIELDQDHFVPDRLPEETRERIFSLLKLYGRMPELRKAPPDAEKGQIANEF
ncbi:iron chelate uptake ABC transporter family permease subunit [Bacillus inaquosorum]|uniref:Manganese transport system membrane protein MntC n=1 Tax=Bacillus inaquosorum TaxID=483913 RepID=A0A9Q4ESM3_9BACI|nr:metal ABC transporter permease [Bacillus inaquosorum]MCY7977759.1 metal ABC transporter permease [Bacillus inaquosorum]MCY8084155.1 metal ABC transporter permease [Bacillus inaquosorum]MCY8170403.1 metal ABC transporter permease [Bacillus inaquosorum]MCY8357341.1 metal ABC transporter permease [Bacillus inaquosorum]MCY8703808.1 metal ABC transporter permease [Bacillus inaquosorum]